MQRGVISEIRLSDKDRGLLRGQNVLKTFEMAIQHNRRGRHERNQREFSADRFNFTYIQKTFFWPSRDRPLGYGPATASSIQHIASVWNPMA